jgi:hypothetical protein
MHQRRYTDDDPIPPADDSLASAWVRGPQARRGDDRLEPIEKRNQHPIIASYPPPASGGQAVGLTGEACREVRRTGV